MKIIIAGSGEYKIVNGRIKRTCGLTFYVKKDGDTLTLSTNGSGIFNNNINIGGMNISSNVVQMNGISISSKGRTLVVDGDVDEIVLNGKRFSLDTSIDSSKKLDKNEYSEYKIEDIGVVSIEGSGKLTIDGKTCGCKILDALMMSISGSGDIDLSNVECNTIMVSVAGSGDVRLYSVSGVFLNISVAGSGDVTGSSCKFQTVNETISGSGDISGF